MAFVRADFVKETSNVTGTGAITLAGARSPARTFASVCSNGDTFRYAISNQSSNEWEVGLGTYNSGPNTITRSPVSSSNANALVNFSVGTKFVDLVVDTAQYNAFLTTAGAGGGVAVSAAGQSASSGTITFSNANNVSFGMAGSVVTASASFADPDQFRLVSLFQAAASQTNSISTATGSTLSASRLVLPLLVTGTNGESAHSKANVAWRFDGSSLYAAAHIFISNTIGLIDVQNISFSNNSIATWNVGPSTVAGLGRVAVVSLSNIAAIRAISLVGVGGITNISQATDTSFTGPGALILPLYSGADSTNLSQANVRYAFAGSALFAAAWIQFLAASPAGGFSAQHVSFSDAGGISWTMSTVTSASRGRIVQYVASVDPLLGLVSHVGGQSVSDVRSLVFSNASNVTFSLSTAAGGATVLASVAAGGGGGITALALSNAVSAVSATGITFSNANGFSFLMSTGAGNAATLSGSYTVPTVPAFAVSAAGASASSGTVVWSNSNNVSFGQAGSTITASATVAATREIGVVSHIGGNVVSSVSQLAFSNASNVTFSLSTAANAATLIASVGAAGGGITYSGFIPFRGEESVVASLANASFMVCPLGDVPAFQFDRVVWAGSFSNNSASTNSNTLRFMVGLYTKNASTLSLVQSSSTSLAFTGSGTVGNYSLFSGFRLLTMGWTSTLGASNYWVACGLSNSTAGNAAVSFSIAMLTQNFSVAPNLFNVANNASAQRILGQGVFTSTSSVAPASMAFSHIIGSNSTGWRAPAVHFASQSA